MTRLGEVIMSRELDGADGKKVKVEVGRPVLYAEGETDCYVPFRIGDGPVMEVGGVDGFHAMIMALGLIGDMAKLDGLTFLGTQGFPVTTPEEGMLVITYRRASMTVLESTT
jgi:hypothetical protein